MKVIQLLLSYLLVLNVGSIVATDALSMLAGVAAQLGAEKRHKCEICDKAFAYQSDLARHERTHTGEKPFKCEQEGCDAAFAHKTHLTRHERIHTGEKPFKCEQEGCGTAFAYKNVLTRHERIHTGEKPFKCEQEGCDAAFTTPSNLSRHKLIHTGERPHKCTYEGCDAVFANPSNLSRHKLIHTGERSFKCNECHKDFNQNAHLANHKCTRKLLTEASAIAASKRVEELIEDEDADIPVASASAVRLLGPKKHLLDAANDESADDGDDASHPAASKKSRTAEV